MLNWFCSEFYRLSSSANFENRLRFDKVTESLQVGPFLRHSVYTCHQTRFVQAQIKTKCYCGRGCAPDPAAELTRKGTAGKGEEEDWKRPQRLHTQL